MINIGIVGGAGYTGGELIRLLVNHPEANILFIHSKSNAGKSIHEIHSDLVGEIDLKFTDQHTKDVEVLFLCVGRGEAKKFLEESNINPKTKIIDLSHDFRLAHSSQLAARSFTYGLPELNRDKIKIASNIANPGCFATAIQLGLLPLAKSGLLSTVHTTGITGSTGAGQQLQSTSHFSWRANNIQAYKTLTHQHLDEIYQSLHQLQSTFPGSPASNGNGLHFVPWRGDFTRGIYVTSYLQCSLSIHDIIELYENYYEPHPFTVISKSIIDLKQVLNTNKCIISLEKVNDQLIIHSVTDNLLKGASGQAVQNMNLMFGIDETTGLRLKASAF